MKISKQQITARGIAQQSGLDTLSGIINYTGEYINWGDGGTIAFDGTTYGTSAANPHTDAIINNPPSVMNTWYLYKTNGLPYSTANSPYSSDAGYVFSGIETGGNPSYCGAYQKLSLIKGKEYEVTIDKYQNTTEGVFTVQVYTPDADDFILVSSVSYSEPTINTSSSKFKTTFTAVSANDIFLISYTTTVSGGSMDSGTISKFSIKEKQEYLIPVYATDMWGNAHKVLRVAADQIIPTDET